MISDVLSFSASTATVTSCIPFSGAADFLADCGVAGAEAVDDDAAAVLCSLAGDEDGAAAAAAALTGLASSSGSSATSIFLTAAFAGVCFAGTVRFFVDTGDDTGEDSG